MSDAFYSDLSWPLPIGGTFDPEANDAPKRSFQWKIANSVSKGTNIRWGMPFEVDKVIMLDKEPVSIPLPETEARWLCFLHTAEGRKLPWRRLDDVFEPGFERAIPIGREGIAPLNKQAAVYYVQYSDGEEIAIPIRGRYEINTANSVFGENCFAAVPEEQSIAVDESWPLGWGLKQYRSFRSDRSDSRDKTLGWIFAWKNPHPEKKIVGLRLQSEGNEDFGTIALWGAVACNTSETPIRWERRQKLVLKLPLDTEAASGRESGGGTPSPIRAKDLRQGSFMYLDAARRRLLDIDMGTVISVVPHISYDSENWESGPFFDYGTVRGDEFVIEFAAHPDAKLRTSDGTIMPLRTLLDQTATGSLKILAPSHKRVTIRVLDPVSRQPVAVRLHMHGEGGEYLRPVDRHRLPNGNWFEDYAPELAGRNLYNSTYIDGHTVVDLPLGPVYLEAVKGFEHKPVRRKIEIDGSTDEITLEIEKVLDWREKGWITADTHVHFLSPRTGNLEGAAEGVNVVNLLASQWGELMTNVGDFDGRSIYSIDEGSDEYLLRVSTENRQNVLGHISLIGYEGPIIAPMCADGPSEGAIGDPVDTLLTEWAEQCKKQNGLVVLPHTPLPRAEGSAAVVSGAIDAFEICAISGFITPFTLVNWYRYLNCGYHLPLTGGTDKMAADMEIGRARVYSRLSPETPFTFENWKTSIRDGNTFVTFGPLVEFDIDGHSPGSRIKLARDGSVSATWSVATVRYAITTVELVANGEIRGSTTVNGNSARGSFELNVGGATWACLLVRGIDNDGNERILAHTSAVMIDVEGREFYSAPDALSILDQIEGCIAYIENIGTRADERRYKEMRLKLEAAHHTLHRRMHLMGQEHSHSVTKDHH